MERIFYNTLKGLRIFMPFLIGLLFNSTNANSQITIHTIDVKNTEEIIDFFRFSAIRSPLISAHRGGSRPGFPENCIATLENTLQYTPVIFEIDPRMTKDGKVVLMHDSTLDRTTTGSGNVGDYTWDELQKLNLKDIDGRITPYKIPLLTEVLEWAKGKTILVLDDKGVPYQMVADLLQKHNAFHYTLMTVRDAGIAKQFYLLDQRFMFEAYIFNEEDMKEFEKAEIPWNHVMAYVGSKDTLAQATHYEGLNERGVKGMISAAPSLDKEFCRGDNEVYQNIFNNGSCIIESDLPIQAAIYLNKLVKKDAPLCKYFAQKVIPLEEIRYIPVNYKK